MATAGTMFATTALIGVATLLPDASAEGKRADISASDGQQSTIEDFAYPGAAEVLANRGIRLHKGDGHLTLADCGVTSDNPPADLILVQTHDLSLPGDPNFCFRATGTSGFLTVEISQVYVIRGESARSLSAKVEVEPAAGTSDPVVVKSERVDPKEWQPMGIGNNEGEATLLELRFPYPT